MIIDFVKLHIAEALSEVSKKYSEEQLDKINLDQLVEDIFNGLNGYFTRDEWQSLKDVIYTMLINKKTLDGIMNIIKGMIVVQSFDLEKSGGIILYN